MRAQVSVPGKLILMGEHSVVFGRPALVTAVDLRVRAVLLGGGDVSPDQPVTIVLETLAHRETTSWRAIHEYARSIEERWRNWARSQEGRSQEGQGKALDFSSVRGSDPGHGVKLALALAAAEVGEGSGGPRLELELRSELPVGGGMGSSAAVAVAVAAGYFLLRGAPWSTGTLDRLALEVERAQHGRPSGVDSASVLRGGVLQAERDASGRLLLSPIAVEAIHLECWRAIDTGSPSESTGEVVAAVRELGRSRGAAFEQLLDHMAECTRRLRRELGRTGSAASIVELIRSFERALEELGVVPEPVRALVRSIEAEGGAAKVSGAGSLRGPGAGALLVYHADPEALLRSRVLGGFRIYQAALAAPGLRVEGGEEGGEES